MTRVLVFPGRHGSIAKSGSFPSGVDAHAFVGEPR
jgi:hypothetical protein